MIFVMFFLLQCNLCIFFAIFEILPFKVQIGNSTIDHFPTTHVPYLFQGPVPADAGRFGDFSQPINFAEVAEPLDRLKAEPRYSDLFSVLFFRDVKDRFW